MHRPVRARPATLAAPLVVFALACGGDDSTGPSSDTPAFIDVENEVTLTGAGETRQLDVTVRNADGTALPDAPVQYSVTPEGIASVSALGLVQALSDGEATITVRAGNVAKAVLVSVDIAEVALEDGVRLTALDGPELGQRYYTFDVPAGDDDRVLLVRLEGGTGDADLVLREGGRPAPGSVDCLSASGPNTLNNLEFCAIPAPAAGTWHVLVYGYEAYEGVALEAVMVPLAALEAGVALDGLQAPTNDLLFFRLPVPAGADLTLATNAAGGDVDLFAGPEDIVSINDVEQLPCVSVGEGSDEQCGVAGAAGGSWLVVLLAFSEFDGLTLTAEVTPE